MAFGGIPNSAVLSSVIHRMNPFTRISSPLSFIERMIFCFVLSMTFSLRPVLCQWKNRSFQDLFSQWHSDVTHASVFSSVAVSPHCATHCQSLSSSCRHQWSRRPLLLFEWIFLRFVMSMAFEGMSHSSAPFTIIDSTGHFKIRWINGIWRLDSLVHFLHRHSEEWLILKSRPLLFSSGSFSDLCGLRHSLALLIPPVYPLSVMKRIIYGLVPSMALQLIRAWSSHLLPLI